MDWFVPKRHAANVRNSPPEMQAIARRVAAILEPHSNVPEVAPGPAISPSNWPNQPFSVSTDWTSTPRSSRYHVVRYALILAKAIPAAISRLNNESCGPQPKAIFLFSQGL